MTVDERTQVAAATVLGAVAGGLLGFLYLTERGRRVRVQIEPMFEALLNEIETTRTTVDKARDVATEGRRALDDVLRTSA